MKTQQINTTSVFRRLAQLVIAVGILIAVLLKWISADNQGKALLSANNDELTHTLATQSAKVAAHFIADKQTDFLPRMLNDIASHPHITQAMIYNQHGSEIARSNQAISAYESYIGQISPYDALTPLNQNQPNKTPNSQWVVSEIRQEAKLLGYLRLNYQQHQALQSSLGFHKQIMQQILLLGLLSGLMGFLLTRGFTRFSRNSFRINN